MSNSDDREHGSEESGPDEELFRKLFGEAFGQQDDSTEEESKSGPSMGFTGNPGSGSGDAGQGGFPGFPPGFDPSQLPGGLGADPQMMQQIMGQVQAMFSAMQNQNSEDVINWDITKNAALSSIGDDDAAVTPPNPRPSTTPSAWRRCGSMRPRPSSRWTGSAKDSAVSSGWSGPRLLEAPDRTGGRIRRPGHGAGRASAAGGR